MIKKIKNFFKSNPCEMINEVRSMKTDISILEQREIKRDQILKLWIDGMSRKELIEKFGDFAQAVIFVEIGKMKKMQSLITLHPEER